jgi:hypothetical protein
MSAVQASSSSDPYSSQISALEQAAGNNPQYDQELQQWQQQIDGAGGGSSGGSESDGGENPGGESGSGTPAASKPVAPAVASSTNTAPPASVPSSSSSSSSSSSGSGASADSSDPTTAIADNLRSQFGLNNTQIAGVLGNLQQESGLTPDINQGGVTGAPSSDNADDNENGYGLCQWGGARKEAEEAYAKQNNEDPGSMQANLGYMDQELKGSYSDTITALKSSTTTDGAALAWDTDYEQASAPNMSARDQYADNFAQKLGSSS